MLKSAKSLLLSCSVPDRGAVHHELVAEPGEAEEDQGQPVEKSEAGQTVLPRAAVRPWQKSVESVGQWPRFAETRSSVSLVLARVQRLSVLRAAMAQVRAG